MRIVIDIDENLYTRLFDNGVDNYDDAVDMAKAIRKGTPLPKGHGRLIDADKIIYHRCTDNVLDCPQSYDYTCQHCDFGITTKFRTDAIPAIIEADKDGE